MNIICKRHRENFASELSKVQVICHNDINNDDDNEDDHDDGNEHC